jgi:hypothetical protein
MTFFSAGSEINIAIEDKSPKVQKFDLCRGHVHFFDYSRLW